MTGTTSTPDIHVPDAARARRPVRRLRDPTMAGETKRHFRNAGWTVRQARLCAGAYRPWSLEQPVAGTGDLRPIDVPSDVPSGAERGLGAVDRRETPGRALAGLPDGERRVVGMRFVGEMTRSQIPERIGVSQMRVSRLLTRPVIRPRDARQADAVVAVPGAGRKGLARQVIRTGSPGGR